MTRLRAAAVLALIALLCGIPASAGAAPSWLTPATVDSWSSGGSEQSSVAVDPKGNATVVWSEYDTKGTADGADDVVVIRAISRPAGGSFGAPETISGNADQPHKDAHEPKVGVDDAGNVIAFWKYWNGTNWQIRYRQRPAGGSWANIRDLTAQAAGETSTALSISVGGGGTVGAIWRRDDVKKAYGAVGSTTSGMDPATPLSAAGGFAPGVFRPGVAVSDNGNAVFVWERDFSSTQWVVEALVKPAGQSYQASPTQLSDSGTNVTAELPDVGVDSRGQATVVFGFRCDSGCAQLQTQRVIKYAVREFPAGGSFATANWSLPALTASESGVATFNGALPEVSVHPDNTAILTYTESSSKVARAATRLPGQSFGAFQSLTGPGSNPWLIDLVSGGGGATVAAFARDTVPATVAAAVRPAGASQFGATELDVDVAPDDSAGFMNPVAAVSDQGDVVLAYVRGACSPSCGPFAERVAIFDNSPPQLSNLDVPGTAVAGTGFDVSASVFDTFSAVSTKWDFGDGTTADGTAVGHSYGVAGTYTVKVTATDVVGNATSAERAIQVTSPASPPPPPPPPPSDADHDGDPAGSDCNDNDPAVHHGATDIPGNGVNEDCVGGDAIVVLRTGITNKWTVFKTYTTVFRLAVSDVPAGATVTVKCKGKGCPFKSKKVTAKTSKTVTLTKLFNPDKKKKAKLKAKATISITVTKPGTIGNWFQAIVQKGLHFPKTKKGCLAVGSSSSKVACS